MPVWLRYKQECKGLLQFGVFFIFKEYIHCQLLACLQWNDCDCYHAVLCPLYCMWSDTKIKMAQENCESSLWYIPSGTSFFQFYCMWVGLHQLHEQAPHPNIPQCMYKQALLCYIYMLLWELNWSIHPEMQRGSHPFSLLLQSNLWWRITLVRENPDESPPGWLTTLMRDQPPERLGCWHWSRLLWSQLVLLVLLLALSTPPLPPPPPPLPIVYVCVF